MPRRAQALVPAFVVVLLSFLLTTPAAPPVQSAPEVAPFWANKAYFFLWGSPEYLRYDIPGDHVDAGYPQALDAAHWPGWPATWGYVDAAVNWGNGKVYFFHATEYLRYDIAADHVDPGYPQPIDAAHWPGWPGWFSVWAAVNWGNGKVYFFAGNQYLRYDIATDHVDPGYPQPLDAAHWPGWPTTFVGTDAAVYWGGQKAYFIRGSKYLRYDVPADHVDPGYPLDLNAITWPGWPASWVGRTVSGGVPWTPCLPNCRLLLPMVTR